MANNTNTFPISHTYNQKPIFFRMIRIIKQNRIFILENGLSLFERNPMLFFVFGILFFVPVKPLMTGSHKHPFMD